MLPSMTLNELRKRLFDLCEESGSQTAFAKKHNIDNSYVSAVIRGNAMPGWKILKAMGMRKSFSAKKTTVMKFEDITN